MARYVNKIDYLCPSNNVKGFSHKKWKGLSLHTPMTMDSMQLTDNRLKLPVNMKPIILILFSLLLAFPCLTKAQTRPLTHNDSVQLELKERIKTAKQKARASRTQLKEDEREVTRLTRELERARRQAQKDKLAARKAKLKGKEYASKPVKVQMENPKTVVAQRRAEAAAARAAKEAKAKSAQEEREARAKVVREERQAKAKAAQAAKEAETKVKPAKVKEEKPAKVKKEKPAAAKKKTEVKVSVRRKRDMKEDEEDEEEE